MCSGYFGSCEKPPMLSDSTVVVVFFDSEENVNERLNAASTIAPIIRVNLDLSVEFFISHIFFDELKF
jgi:hypothetical protein